MKNAMKKLMSLMLVAVLLVGMIPFAASAATYDVSIDVDGKNALVTNGSSVNYSDCANYVAEDRQITKIVYEGDAVDGTKTLNEGESVTLEGVTRFFVFTESKAVEPQEPAAPQQPAAPQEPVQPIYDLSIDVNGVQKVLTNGTFTTYEECLTAAGIDTNEVNITKALYEYTTSNGVQSIQFKAGDVITLSADTRIFFFTEKKAAATKPTTPTETKPADKVVDEEWMKDIYLYIYTNNDIIQPSKRVLLNNYTIVNDHVLSKAEILTVVDDYYKASNANTGIVWKGAYRETENITALDFVAGRDETPITGLDVDRSLNTVIIKVRVTGVTTVGTTYTADSSNPKTGDSIYTAMTVMGISAAALASVMYFYNKKRMAL